MPDAELPAVSVIVPARDEESCIGACLESLACQNYPNFEVVIIDDASTDGTGAIIQALAAKYPCIKPLKSCGAPPPGWMGKCHALVQAVPHASGHWFVFIDADTIHKPEMLRHALSFVLTQKASLVSFWSKHRLVTFAERMMTPALFCSFEWGDPKLKIHALKEVMAYAIGHCIVVDRNAYFAVGGHRAAREWRIDDHALAMLLKYQGFPICIADGRQMFTVRMFTDFESFWFGWAKQIFAIFRFRLFNVCCHLIEVVGMFVLPFAQLVLLILLGAAGQHPSAYISGYVPVLTLLVAAQMIIVGLWYAKIRAFHEGAGWGYLLLLPITGMIIVALDLYSAALVLTGAPMTWKGRSYRITRPKVPPEPIAWKDPYEV